MTRYNLRKENEILKREINAMRDYNSDVFKELCIQKRKNDILLNELKSKKDKEMLIL